MLALSPAAGFVGVVELVLSTPAGGDGASSARGGADGSELVVELGLAGGVSDELDGGVSVVAGVPRSSAKAGLFKEITRLNANSARLFVIIDSSYGKTSIVPAPPVTDCLRFLYFAGRDIFPFP